MLLLNQKVGGLVKKWVLIEHGSDESKVFESIG